MEYQDRNLVCVDCGTGVRLFGGGTAVLCSQEFQERAEKMQRLQVKKKPGSEFFQIEN